MIIVQGANGAKTGEADSHPGRWDPLLEVDTVGRHYEEKSRDASVSTHLRSFAWTNR